MIAPLPDRIVQRAILDVLQDGLNFPSVREVLETATSIGGIKDRGVDRALDLIDAAFANGARHIAGSDIAGFFTKIPRSAVVEFVRASVRDDEFTSLFKNALTVELENADSLAPEDLDMFPTGPDGVAQGCPLSAFAGNVILHDFDKAMNDRGVTCIRYIDDFAVVASSREKVVKAMASAKRMLSDLGMRICDPATHPSKAFVGQITDGKTFLGYDIVPGLYPPSSGAKAGLITRIEAEIKTGKAAMVQATGGSPVSTHAKTYAYTLTMIDKVIHGWASSFKRSQCIESRIELDKKISRMLDDFERFYRQKVDQLDASGKRRVTGVRLLADDRP